MAYRIKQRIVEAEPVGSILQIAASDFKSLPAWIKKGYQDQNLFFGFSSLRVVCGSFIKDADADDVLVGHECGRLEVMSHKTFHKIYEAIEQ